MKKFLNVFSIILTIGVSNAQTFETIIPAPILITPCADSNNSFAIDIAKLNNDHVVLSGIQFGSTDCPLVLGSGYLLSRLNEFGDTLFNKHFYHPNQLIDSSGGYRGIALEVSEDGSIYVVGEELMIGQPDQIFVSKHTPSGNLLWKMNYGNSNVLRPFVLLADSSNIYIGGHSYLPYQGAQPGIMKIDNSGLLQWVMYSDTTAFANVHGIIKRSTDYVLIGSQIVPNSGSINYQIFTVPFNASGLDSTIHFYGNPANSYDHADAIYNIENELTIAAYSSYYQDVLFLEIDDNNLILDQFIMQPSTNLDYYRMRNLVQLHDSSYVLVGQTGYFNVPNSIFNKSINILKVNHLGYVLWMKEYAGYASESLVTNNGIIIAGERLNQDINIVGYYSALVMKVDSLGNTANCLPQFVRRYTDSPLSDTVLVNSYIHLHNNSFGEASNFYWTVNGNTSGQLLDFSDTYIVMDSGWHVISLIGCGTSFTDSIYASFSDLNIYELTSSNSINFKIYPNPSKGNFTIDIKDFHDGTKLEVLDLFGRSVFVTEINQNKTNLKIEEESGIYVIQITNGEQTSLTKLAIE